MNQEKLASSFLIFFDYFLFQRFQTNWISCPILLRLIFFIGLYSLIWDVNLCNYFLLFKYCSYIVMWPLNFFLFFGTKKIHLLEREVNNPQLYSLYLMQINCCIVVVGLFEVEEYFVSKCSIFFFLIIMSTNIKMNFSYFLM